MQLDDVTKSLKINKVPTCLLDLERDNFQVYDASHLGTIEVVCLVV